MAAGIVYHNIVTKTGVDFTIAGWVPDTGSPDANLIPVSMLVDLLGVPIAKAEDAAHSSGDFGFQMLAVQKLTPVNLGADGDYGPLQISTGQLHVNAGHWQGVTNGVLAAPFATVAGSGNTNGLDGLTSGSAATSASGYSQSDTLGAKEAYVYYLSGDTTWTPSGAGANIAVWFLLSMDGGSTYESAQNTPSTTVPALSRPPDAVIPLDLVATGTGGVKKFATGRVKLPPGTFKVVAQNNGGATMGDTTTVHAGIYIAPVA